MYLFTTVPHPHGHWQLQELLGNSYERNNYGYNNREKSQDQGRRRDPDTLNNTGRQRQNDNGNNDTRRQSQSMEHNGDNLNRVRNDSRGRTPLRKNSALVPLN